MKVEQELKKSEESYRSLFDNMLNGFAYCEMVVDENDRPVDFICHDVNDAFERLTGLLKKDIVGRRVTDVIPGIEKAHPDVFRIYGNVASTGEPTAFELFFEPLAIWLYISVYSPEQGFFAAVFDNITKRKMAEKRLEDSEQLYRGLLEATGGTIVRVDRQGHRSFMAGSIEPLFGMTVEEYEAGEFGDTMVPEDREGNRVLLDQMFETGKPVRRIVTRHETDQGLKHVATNWQPIKDVQGNVVSVQLTGYDISEQVESDQRREETLRRSEELYRGLVSASGSAVVRVDRQGNRIVAVGDIQGVYGRTIEEFESERATEGMLPGDARKAWVLFDHVVKTGEPVTGYVSRWMVGGEIRYISANWEPIKDPQGNVVELQTTAIDITELAETENRLTQSEEFFRGLVSLEHTAIARYDLKGNRTFANDAFFNRVNAKRDKVIGSKLDEFAPPEERDKIWASFRKCIETKRVISGVVTRYETPEGVKWNTGTYVPILDTNGEPEGVHIGSVDITELMETQEALHRSEEMYRNLVKGTGSAVVRVDREGKRTYVGGDVERLHGRSTEEMLAGNFGDNNTAENKVRIRKLLAEAFRTGEGVRGLVAEQRGNDVPRYTTSNWEPIKDVHGHVIEIQTTTTDVTELVETREALHQHAQEMEALSEMASILVEPGTLEEKGPRVLDVIARIADGDRVILRRADESEQLLRVVATKGPGLSRLPVIAPALPYGEGITGQAFEKRELTVVNDYPSHPMARPEVIEYGLNSFVAIPIEVGDIALGTVEICSLEPDHFTPELVELVEVVANGAGVLLENARLEEEAREAESLTEMNEAKSRLLSTVSHELRTPLAAIQGYASTALTYWDRIPEEEKQEYFQDIVHNSKLLTELIEQLLDMSRLETGMLSIDKRENDIGRSVQRAVEKRKEMMTEKHQLVVDISSELPRVNIDSRRIEQVVDNLLSNAVKYSPDGGEIRVRVEVKNGGVVVSVEDEGIGITEEDRERVFDMLYRAEDERAKASTGTGLGLALCKGIVEAHDGKIWVESTPGKGSTFYFTLLFK